MVSIPSLLTSLKVNAVPISNTVPIWTHTYYADRAQNPFIALASAEFLVFCAWTTPTTDSEMNRKFWTAAASALVIIPYTTVVVNKTLERLIALDNRAEKEDLEAQERVEAYGLLRW